MACPAGVCSGEPPAVWELGPRGVAWLVGTRRDVWEVVAGLEREGSEARLARKLGLTEHQVRVAREYWERHPERVARDRARLRG